MAVSSLKMRTERRSLPSFEYYRKPISRMVYDLEEKQRYRELLQTFNINGFNNNRHFGSAPNHFSQFTSTPVSYPLANGVSSYSSSSLNLETTLNDLRRLQHNVNNSNSADRLGKYRLLSAATPIRQKTDRIQSVYSFARRSLENLDRTSSCSSASSTPKVDLHLDRSPPIEIPRTAASSSSEIISLDGEDILANYEKGKRITATQLDLERARRSYSSFPDSSSVSKGFENDPFRLCSTYRKELLEKRLDREKCVDELSVETLLRQKARLAKQKSHEKEIRCRMRFEGLIISEPEDLFPELTDEQRFVISNAFNSGSLDDVLVEEFNIPLKRRDIQTLAGLNWLNDEIINFYFNLIMTRGGKNGLPSVYVCNTFFYPKLIQGGLVSLKRWTRKVDIFSHDLMLMPIHLGVHWCLAVVDFRNKVISYYDSMGGSNRPGVEAIKHYLVEESLDKRKQAFDLTGWKDNFLKNIPQQMNGSDCGMFACKFADYASRNAEVDFTQEHMAYFRERMVYELVTKQLL